MPCMQSIPLYEGITDTLASIGLTIAILARKVQVRLNFGTGETLKFAREAIDAVDRAHHV
jgi:hypothetical protein